MFFLNDEHENNYNRLLELFGLVNRKDSQYEATLYISAIPDLYVLLDEINADYGSPLNQLMKWNDEGEKYIIDSPALTGTTRRLVSLGMSCFNGYNIDLNDYVGNVSDEYFIVLLEVLRIRRNTAL